MRQTNDSVQKSIAALRAIIDNPATDPITRRMAYFGENTLRWSKESTVDWDRPEEDLIEEVRMLTRELESIKTT